jgi:hypothetical protein
LGDEAFVNKMQGKIPPETNLSEIPSSQRRQVAKSLEYYEKNSSDRNDAICKAYKSGAYSMKAIGDYFKLHYSRVSRIIKANIKT